MPEKRVILSDRSAPNRIFDVVEPDVVPQLYVDGTSRLMIGTEVSKIEFIQSTGPKREGEFDVDQREIVLRLSIPTSAIIEFCAMVLEQQAAHTVALDAARDLSKKTLSDAVKRVRDLKL